MYSLSSRSKQSPYHAQRGFGLIELLVSISLMVLVMAIVLVQQTAFNGAVLLRSQAFEIALQIREVQLNAVSVAAAADVATGQVFRAAYGVHFNTGTNKQLFSIYRDNTTGANANNKFYDSTTETFGAQGILDERFEVREVRTIVNGVATVRPSLSIVFERPNFDARFFVPNGTPAEVVADSVHIVISRKNFTGNTNDVIRIIEVTSAGQIAVLES